MEERRKILYGQMGNRLLTVKNKTPASQFYHFAYLSQAGNKYTINENQKVPGNDSVCFDKPDTGDTFLAVDGLVHKNLPRFAFLDYKPGEVMAGLNSPINNHSGLWICCTSFDCIVITKTEWENASPQIYVRAPLTSENDATFD